MTIITGFFRFWYDFIVGDAWEIAAGIVVVLVLGALLVHQGLSAATILPIVALGVLLVVAGSVFAEARRRARA